MAPGNKFGKKLNENDVNAIEKFYAEGGTPVQVQARWGISDTIAYDLRLGRHGIQKAREARKKAQDASKPCPKCGRPLVPPCRICAMRSSGDKAKALADEATLKARAARAQTKA